MAFWNLLESEPCLSAAFLTAAQFPQSAFIPDVPHHSLCPATATSNRNNGATSLSPRMRWLCCASSANKRRAVLGIDVGTSATKAALCFIDQKGRLGPISRVAHETLSYGNQQVTQRVSDWFGAALRTGREALANAQEDEHVVAISVTGTSAARFLCAMLAGREPLTVRFHGDLVCLPLLRTDAGPDRRWSFPSCPSSDRSCSLL